MRDMIGESLEIRSELIAVTHRGASRAVLIAKCDAWLGAFESAQQEARDSRFRVAQKLDLLDQARDYVRAVRGKCVSLQRQAAKAA